MRSLSSLLTGRSSRPAPPAAPPPPPGTAALRDDVLAHGVDAGRALALADALERDGRLLDALDALLAAVRLRRDVGLERRLVRLRRAAFAALDRSLPSPAWPPHVPDDPPGADGGPPVLRADQLTAGALRNGILRHGSCLVRGLVPASRTARLRDAIDRAFEAYDATVAGHATDATRVWYDPLDGIPDGISRRAWMRQAESVLAADVPRAFHEFLETVHEAGVDRVIEAYLGERPALSWEKCTLRRVDAKDWRMRLSNWHQDGAFLGKGIRTVDAWFSLSTCGRDAPGMEIVPVRLDRLLPTGEPGTHYQWTVSPETIARDLPGVRIWRPEFEPGDVLFFDERCLHRTYADESMPNVRYAIESWFFAPSVYPADTSTPLLV